MTSDGASLLPVERNVRRLAASIFPFLFAQVLSGSVVVVLTSISGVIGNQLSPRLWMVTLPNSLTILGTLVSIWPIARLIETAGWRNALLAGIAAGIVGGGLAIIAIQFSNFELYCTACILLGACIASVQYYVFGAAEVARTTSERRVVISLMTGCGFASAFLGSGIQRLASYATYLDQRSSSFLLLSGILCIAAFSLALAPYPTVNATKLEGPKLAAAGWRELMGGPFCGMLVAACAFANMTLLMHATPIAMQLCGLHSNDIATVLQWHFVAMYAPAVVMGIVAARISPATTAAVGVLIGVISCAVGYWSDPTNANFTIALVTCGVAWGLMFPAGTALMLERIDAEQRVKVQGLATLIVYGTNCLFSFSTGPIVDIAGWQMLSLIALGPLCIGACAIAVHTATNNLQN